MRCTDHVVSVRLSQPGLLLGITLLLTATWGWADEQLASVPRVRISGFGTLGMVYSSQDDLHAQRDWGQSDTFQGAWSWKLDSLLGLQMNARLTSEVDAAIQFVLKDRPEMTLEESLEWAFLAWKPTDRLVLRGGRLGLDFYMLSDYRNVSFAYLWQRPPIEFYGPLMPHNVDGLDLTYGVPFGGGTLLARLFGGTTTQGIELLTASGADNIELTPLWGGSLSYESEQWRLKAGFSHITFDNNLSSLSASGLLTGLDNPLVQWAWSPADRYAADITMAGKRVGFYALGSAFDDNTWLISGELGYLDSDWGPLRDALSAYLSVGRRWGNLTPYLLLATIRPVGEAQSIASPSPVALNDPTIAALYEGTRELYRNLWSDQQTASLGLRWDVANNLALKFQWDHSEIKYGGLWWNQSGVAPLPNTSLDLLSASLNWVF